MVMAAPPNWILLTCSHYRFLQSCQRCWLPAYEWRTSIYCLHQLPIICEQSEIWLASAHTTCSGPPLLCCVANIGNLAVSEFILTCAPHGCGWVDACTLIMLKWCLVSEYPRASHWDASAKIVGFKRRDSTLPNIGITDAGSRYARWWFIYGFTIALSAAGQICDWIQFVAKSEAAAAAARTSNN